MPIPQETITESAAPTSDIPKIKEKPLPASDSTTEEKPVDTVAAEVKDKEEGEKVDAAKPVEKEVAVDNGNGKVEDKSVEEKTEDKTEEEKTEDKSVEEKTENKPVEVAEEAKELTAEEKTSESETVSGDSAQAPSTPKKPEGEMTENPDLTPKKAEAFNLLAQGKRHYFVKDYESAVETLGEVCEKFSSIYGETGTEMGDVYYYYGISLLELAREEANLLNVDKDKEEEEEDDDEEMEEGGDDGKPGGGVGEKKIGEEEEKEAGKDEEKKEDEKEEAKEAEKVEGGDETAVVDETLKEGEATMEEDEVNNLQLAWEMLELSRSIYLKVGNELKLADIYLKLSEVSMESENYPAAIEDIEKGLAVYVKELANEHRNIAEAHYKLGMAHANNDNYPEAVKQFQLSKETLLARVDNLKTTDKPDAEISKEPFYKKESEIKELEALLPEINARIEECNSDNKEIKKVISNFISGKRPVSDDGAGPSSAVDAETSGASSSSKPASDISHLVKKKRKPEDEKTEVEGKKIKLDDSTANQTSTDEKAIEAASTDASSEDVDMKPEAAGSTGKSTDE